MGVSFSSYKESGNLINISQNGQFSSTIMWLKNPALSLWNLPEITSNFWPFWLFFNTTEK